MPTTTHIWPNRKSSICCRKATTIDNNTDIYAKFHRYQGVIASPSDERTVIPYGISVHDWCVSEKRRYVGNVRFFAAAAGAIVFLSISFQDGKQISKCQLTRLATIVLIRSHKKFQVKNNCYAAEFCVHKAYWSYAEVFFTKNIWWAKLAAGFVFAITFLLFNQIAKFFFSFHAQEFTTLFDIKQNNKTC